MVAILSAVWLAMAIFIGVHVLSGFHVGLSSCLPADFPRYSQASLASVVISDSFGDCTVQYRTRDSAAEVQTFFETRLNEGDWTVTAVDAKAGLIRFRRPTRSGTIGYVKVFGFPGQQTQFQIQIRTR